MTLVYDASSLLDLVPGRSRGAAAALLKRTVVPIHGAVAPVLIVWELGNALLRGLAGGAPSDAARVVEKLLVQVRLLPTTPQNRERTMAIAQEQNLSFYDASYVATAETIDGSVLITEDRRLLYAARQRLGPERAHSAKSACRAFDAQPP